MHTTILGAGVSGLSCSFHLNHENCQIFEKSSSWGGHAKTITRKGFTLDQGPHVSFTKNDYVKNLLSQNLDATFNEFEADIRNFYDGTWIDHPAQANLWQLPEPLRSDCAREMLDTKKEATPSRPETFKQWLEQAYGEIFARNLPGAYTKKYWTVPAEKMTTDWLGPRMPVLERHQLEKALKPPGLRQMNYISKVRYPKSGGFQKFFGKFAEKANIRYNMEVAKIDLHAKKIHFYDGSVHEYQNLVSTLPLDVFLTLCEPDEPSVQEALLQLDCTQLLLVDVFSPHAQRIAGHWFYVYDEDKLSTRIHCVERLAESNAPDNWTGIQVEVYFSKYKSFNGDIEDLKNKILAELVVMGFVDPVAFERDGGFIETRWISHANVLFTHQRAAALDVIWSWLGRFGLEREPLDLTPAGGWENDQKFGPIAMAGRFAQWKYYWTDDCILRGRQLATSYLVKSTDN